MQMEPKMRNDFKLNKTSRQLPKRKFNKEAQEIQG